MRLDKWEYNKYLFAKYQRFLLSIVNTKIGKYFFKIPDNKFIGKRKIYQINPNGIVYHKNKKEVYVDFYTNQRMALNIAFLLEFFEIISFVDYFKTFKYAGIFTVLTLLFFHGLPVHHQFPSITLTDFNPNTGDGRVGQQAVSTWATAHDSASGTNKDGLLGLQARNATGIGFYDDRGYMPFDTSSLGAGFSIDSATLKLYRDDSIATMTNDDSGSVIVIPQSQASPTALALSDFSLVTYTNEGSIAFSATTNAAYNDISLSTSFINVTGYTKAAIVHTLDFNNTAPTSGHNNYIFFQNHADANPPILRIIAAATTNIKTVNGLAKANVKTFNGLAIGNVKTINGLS